MCVVLTKRGNALEWRINHYIFILYDANFYTVLDECINYIINRAFNNNNNNNKTVLYANYYSFYMVSYTFIRGGSSTLQGLSAIRKNLLEDDSKIKKKSYPHLQYIHQL